MDKVRIIEVKQDILGDNDKRADALRQKLYQEKTCFINLMSSPGAGKTTTLLRTADMLKDALRIAILEADIDSAVDAERVNSKGIPTIQLHTGGMCHLDAAMTEEGLQEIDSEKYDLVFLENIGNLVCPAEFDTGATLDMMILSVPEGDDKPLKYPLMFTKAKVLLVNKIDYLSMTDFDMETLKMRVRALNPEIRIFEVSARTGEGFEAWTQWLLQEVKKHVE